MTDLEAVLFWQMRWHVSISSRNFRVRRWDAISVHMHDYAVFGCLSCSINAILSIFIWRMNRRNCFVFRSVVFDGSKTTLRVKVLVCEGWSHEHWLLCWRFDVMNVFDFRAKWLRLPLNFLSGQFMLSLAFLWYLFNQLSFVLFQKIQELFSFVLRIFYDFGLLFLFYFAFIIVHKQWLTLLQSLSRICISDELIPLQRTT